MLASRDIEVAMDPTQAREAAELLKLLADPTRLSILATLRQARQPVCIATSQPLTG